MPSRRLRPLLCALILIAGVTRRGAAGQGPDEFGRGAYAPGPGIESPVLLQSEKPAYPQSALDARIQGTVELESPGGGLVKPVLAAKVEPKYTREAMRQKIQGSVELEAVVEKDGTVGPVRVTKSLDSAYGLDDAAMAAAKQWTFRPGTVNGQPVRVIVKLVLEFRLH